MCWQHGTKNSPREKTRDQKSCHNPSRARWSSGDQARSAPPGTGVLERNGETILCELCLPERRVSGKNRPCSPEPMAWMCPLRFTKPQTPGQAESDVPPTRTPRSLSRPGRIQSAASLCRASAFLPCSCLLVEAGVGVGESASVDFAQAVKLLSDLALLSITDTFTNLILA